MTFVVLWGREGQTRDLQIPAKLSFGTRELCDAFLECVDQRVDILLRVLCAEGDSQGGIRVRVGETEGTENVA